MIFNLSKDIKFSTYYKKLNIISFILIFLSIFLILFKGLNLGVDFKGGTLIEIRAENTEVDIGEIRQSLIKMQLGDINVKKFLLLFRLEYHL
jgi:preprotein translocase subunit SecF